MPGNGTDQQELKGMARERRGKSKAQSGESGDPVTTLPASGRSTEARAACGASRSKTRGTGLYEASALRAHMTNRFRVWHNELSMELIIT